MTTAGKRLECKLAGSSCKIAILQESTKSIELLQQSTGIGGSGTEFYEFDYAISTSRGDKRILSKVGVANSKLYIVNASIKCEAEACKDETKLVQLIRQSVQSFDIRT